MSEWVVDEYGLAAAAPATPEAARDFCARLTRAHYENFTVVSWFLPRELRQHFANVYAYCRVSDDLADEVTDDDASLRLLDDWRDQLHQCYAGTVRHPVFVALAETIARFDVPVEPFDRLLDAFCQDRRQTRYRDFANLCGYCRNSANPVGHLVLYLGGYRDAERQRLSDQTCTALQLANFWQDVARDHDKGRIYLPLDEMASHGVSEQQLAERRCDASYRALLRFQVERTRELFRAGMPLLDTLAGHIRRDVTLFTAGGMKILDLIEGQDYDTLTRRPALSRAGKVGLMLRVLVGARPWR